MTWWKRDLGDGALQRTGPGEACAEVDGLTHAARDGVLRQHAGALIVRIVRPCGRAGGGIDSRGAVLDADQSEELVVDRAVHEVVVAIEPVLVGVRVDQAARATVAQAAHVDAGLVKGLLDLGEEILDRYHAKRERRSR